MRPEAHREMSKRVDCLSLRLSCLEITATTSKRSDHDFEIAMKELHDVRRNIEKSGNPEGTGAPREVGSLTSEGAVEVDVLPANVLR